MTTTIHVLAGCGSFMAGLCTIAQQASYQVIAYDSLFQSPMKDQLAQAGILMCDDYDNADIQPEDVVIVGNAIKRGLPLLERLMAAGHKLHSGAQWLAEHILSQRQLIAVAGTHGKTTTTALSTWVLSDLDQDPGFLIGGISKNRGTSAHCGHKPWFVIEADEYDTAFFDKRPKFIHYQARCVIFNNLEYDHADIYPNLEAIKNQIRYYLNTLKPQSLVVYPADCPHLSALVQNAPWCQAVATYDHTQHPQSWSVSAVQDDWSTFRIHAPDDNHHEITWPLIGRYNACNAMKVMACFVSLGFSAHDVATAITRFQGVARRMSPISAPSDLLMWDDYAHHPTAVREVLATLKKRQPQRRLLGYFQLSNYTQREGLMWQDLIAATADLDLIFIRRMPGNFPYDAFKKEHNQTVIILDQGPLDPHSILPWIQAQDQIISCSSRCCHDFHTVIQQFNPHTTYA